MVENEPTISAAKGDNTVGTSDLNQESQYVTNSLNSDSLIEAVTSATTPVKKVNAFQFMMNNRHKSIGTNSPGKELDLSVENNVDKKELRVRKEVLENWADLKGASKRKREYEEQQIVITQKLDERAKKLKSMLKINSQSDDEIVVRKKRRCVQIESDEESQNVEIKTPEEKKKKRKKIKKLSLSKKKTSENNKSFENQDKVKKNSSKHRKTKIKLDSDETKDFKTALGEKEDNVILDIDKKVEEPNGEISSNGNMTLRTRKPRSKLLDEEMFSLSDEEWEPSDNKKRRSVKVAPVFLKATPKPKLDPAIVEAKRKFLLSGIPDSLKKEKEKQQSIEEAEFDVFPRISHIQQKTDHTFWNLPEVNIDLVIVEKTKKFDFGLFSISEKRLIPKNQNEQNCNLNKLTNYKKIVKLIKLQNKNYPVYKIFKSLYNRSGYKVPKTNENVEKKSPPKRRGRPKKKNALNKSTVLANVPTSQPKTEENHSPDAMWTEKYKPDCSDDILGNRKSVSRLKDWLTSWSNLIKEKKKLKRGYNSDDFVVTDSDSRDSTTSYSSTMILKGPHGSGKTSAVYAVCKELGLSVLEVNASSRRTGKWLLQELQEATQSHQVRKKDILPFVTESKSLKQKACVLLVEDIDVVFDQDEGFITALMQIMSTSKRPIILTATDDTAPNLQKVLTHRKSVSFSPLSSVLSVWLQIVCLIEGYYVTKGSLETLLRYNKGDIRRTLLDLQYWVTSGGQRDKNETINEIAEFEPTNDDLVVEDDNSNMSDFNLEEEMDCKETVHNVDISSFATVEKCELFNLPQENNLEIVWWNLPRLLNLPDFRLNDNEYIKSLEVDKVKERRKLFTLSKFYDALAFVDTISDRNLFHESLQRSWCKKPKNGLGLGENVNSYIDVNFYNDIGNALVIGHLKGCRRKFENTYIDINMVVPSASEQRWHRKQLNCEEKLKGALLVSDCLRRKATALDYMPFLRSIVRSEKQKADNSMKRRNRFYSSLRSFRICGDESVYQTACNVFNRN